MKGTRRWLAAGLVAAVPLVSAPRAEVSAETSAAINVLILGVIEGPDPISQGLWQPVRDVDPSLFLNPDGALRNDGRPHVAFDGETGWPHVVWAYDAAGVFEIAHSQWTGAGWSSTELLSSKSADQLDPRVHVAAGGHVHVVWWEPADQRLWLTIRPGISSNWRQAEAVTSALESGRRPSVVTWTGQVLVAYERDGTFNGQEILVATRMAQGVYASEVVATSDRTEALEVQVHAAHGRLWVDWRDSETAYGWSVFEAGAWGEVSTLPWTDGSWKGDEQARLAIRSQVLGD